MAKMKVFELAKKMKLDEKDLLLKIQEMGLNIDDVEMTLEPVEIKILEDKISKEKRAEVVEERIKPTVIRRRAKKKPKEGVEEKEKKVVKEKGDEKKETKETKDIKGIKETAKTAAEKKKKIKKVAKEEKPTEVVKEVKAKEGIEVAPVIPPKKKEVVADKEVEDDVAGEVPEVKEERVLRKRLKTVSKDEITDVVRHKVIRKAQKEEAPPKKEKKKDKKDKKGAADAKETAPDPQRDEAEKRFKKKKRPQDTSTEKPRKRSLKKREVVVQTADSDNWNEGKQFKGEKKRKRHRKKKAVPTAKRAKKVFNKPLITIPKASKRVVKVEDVISVGELARQLGIKVGEIIKKLEEMGIETTSINNIVDLDTASLVAHDYDYEVENVAFEEESIIKEVEDKGGELITRPPVVTIMGHVDHGKTTLLDAIRETNVVGSEFGGITQHIGAYEVNLGDKKIVFLDTPGHEAFTTMRARGADVTDIVLLIIAADDGVMPQTVEAINHAKAADVPIIVVINKIDRPDASPDKIKRELMEHSLLSEEMGGDTIFVEVSAKEKKNLNELLEMISIQAEILELTANPNKLARGVVVEANLDRGRGPIATILVNEGTLNIGDHFVIGLNSGRIRALVNDKGENVESTGPSIPVEILGLSGVPNAGDPMIVVENEKIAKEVSTHRQMKSREKDMVAPQAKVTLEELYEKIEQEGTIELNLIIKADVQGSAEALSENLVNISTDVAKIIVIHSSTGSITETDVMLASASGAIVIGFSVRPEPKVAELAEAESVEIKYYNVIYDCVDDIRKALTGMLAPKLVEKTLGRAEVREIFTVPKIGAVAGSYVTEGKILRNSHVRLIRNNEVIHEGKMSSLRRFKDDTKEVASGYECGIKIENFNEIKPLDIIEAFEVEEVAQEL